LIYVIITLLFGETGENPVRARRREGCKKVFFLLCAANKGQAIGVRSEKVKNIKP
jgi:hypothetical protein